MKKMNHNIIRVILFLIGLYMIFHQQALIGVVFIIISIGYITIAVTKHGKKKKWKW